MFFRGSSGSSSTGVVTWYMTKLSREVRRNCGSGPSERQREYFIIIFSQFLSKRLEQCVSLSDKPKRRRRGGEKRRCGTKDNLENASSSSFSEISLSILLCLFCLLSTFALSLLGVSHQPLLSQPLSQQHNLALLAFSGIPPNYLIFLKTYF